MSIEAEIKTGNAQVDVKVQKAYVCTICETILVGPSGIAKHKCFEGYTRIHIDNHKRVSPRTEFPSIIRRSRVNNHEETVKLYTSETPTNTLELLDSDISLEKRLIRLVHDREPLWNLKCPLTLRNKEIKNELWEEVQAAIGSEHAVADLKKKWKNLVDTHRRVLHVEKDGKKRKRWAYYDIMSFMRDVYFLEKEIKSRTATPRISENEDSNISKLEQIIPVDEEMDTAYTPLFETEDLEVVDKVGCPNANSLPMNIFKFPEIPPPPLPKVPQSSDAAFGTFIECSLREIEDPHDRSRVKKALMDTLMIELHKIAERRCYVDN